ncbi:chromate transporter [Sporobacter termitidis DSM 10068]|uniref:Chromate transporter n=1 Tax=Sporobacter termitidis DSM 10068 TaxID=1123282 RepID=A0A1M5XD49_9FIRM|nr:chromate transporter [Sporobacter termitidis]SHH97750.1 chromate transporter [Sporobacter termitidis DSM 10068]
MIYLRLFFEFFKAGLFSFGGALAAVPFLKEMGERTGWFSPRQLADIIAVAQSAPGPIGVNMASHAGYIVASVWGGVAATLGIVAPSLLIMLAVARVLTGARKNTLLISAFSGLRPASVGLIAAAEVGIVKTALLNAGAWKTTDSLASLFDWKAVIFAVVLFFLTDNLKAHPIVWIAFSMLIGVAFQFGHPL